MPLSPYLSPSEIIGLIASVRGGPASGWHSVGCCRTQSGPPLTRSLLILSLPTIRKFCEINPSKIRGLLVKRPPDQSISAGVVAALFSRCQKKDWILPKNGILARAWTLQPSLNKWNKLRRIPWGTPSESASSRFLRIRSWPRCQWIDGPINPMDSSTAALR